MLQQSRKKRVYLSLAIGLFLYLAVNFLWLTHVRDENRFNPDQQPIHLGN